MVPPTSQNTVGICNQVTHLILCYVSSGLVTALIVDHTVGFKFIYFGFQYFFFLFLKYLLASRLTLFRISTLLWFGSCKKCILVCFETGGLFARSAGVLPATAVCIVQLIHVVRLSCARPGKNVYSLLN